MPAGAALAGTVFWGPDSTSTFGDPAQAEDDGLDVADAWTALMVIDGDPFEAWDDLAKQVRDGEIRLPMGGSLDSCLWRTGGSSDGPEGSEVTISEEIDEREQAWIDEVTVSAAGPPAGAEGVECYATVTTGGPAENSRRYELALEWTVHGPATLRIRAGYDPFHADAAVSRASRTDLVDQARSGVDGPTSPPSEPRPDRVPAGTSATLAPAVPQPVVQVGDPFGGSVNCFARAEGSTLADRTVLPPGAKFVATGWGLDAISVIALKDADVAVADLRRQFEGDGTDDSSEPWKRSVTLDDGRTVSLYTHSISAGGGSCTMTTSPDGRFLRIERHAD